MREPETCPRCAHAFHARERLLSHGVRAGYNVFAGDGPAVRCPRCWHEFPSTRFKLFGALPAQSLRWVVAALLAVCVLILFVQRQGS